MKAIYKITSELIRAAIHVLARGFYALYDTKAPIGVDILSIAINTLLSVCFIRIMGYPVWSEAVESGT